MQLKCKFRLCIPKIYAENKSCIRKEEKEEGKRIHRNKRDKIYAGGDGPTEPIVSKRGKGLK